MENIIKMLFVRNYELDKSVFRNLYYSSFKSSFAGFELDLLIENKKYLDYKLIKSVQNNIGEYHIEYKAIIKFIDLDVFVRILKDNDGYIYDILIYKINDLNDFNKYDRIFFRKEIELPQKLKNLDKCILYIDNNVNIVKNVSLFSNYLGYEDWDYKNKCCNMIDSSTNDLIINDFRKRDFKKKYKFKKNGGEFINLILDIKYMEGFYYIDLIEYEK